jgi:hypothetical protein
MCRIGTVYAGVVIVNQSKLFLRGGIRFVSKLDHFKVHGQYDSSRYFDFNTKILSQTFRLLFFIFDVV